MNVALKALIIGLIVAAIIVAIICFCVYVRKDKKPTSAQLKNQTERFTTSNTPWNSAIDQFVYDYVTSELGEKP